MATRQSLQNFGQAFSRGIEPILAALIAKRQEDEFNAALEQSRKALVNPSAGAANPSNYVLTPENQPAAQPDIMAVLANILSGNPGIVKNPNFAPAFNAAQALVPKYEQIDPTKDLYRVAPGQRPTLERSGTPRVSYEEREVPGLGITEDSGIKFQTFEKYDPTTGKSIPGSQYRKKVDDLTFSPFSGMNQQAALRREFNSDPIVKEYKDVITKVRVAEEAYQDALRNPGNVAAADQALITMFNKLTDPNSVVRESEYARTPENVALVNRAKGFVEKIQSGGSGITMADRGAIVRMAKLAFRVYEDKYKGQKKRYVQLANSYHIDPKNVVDVDEILEGGKDNPADGSIYHQGTGNRGRGF